MIIEEILVCFMILGCVVENKVVLVEIVLFIII